MGRLPLLLALALAWGAAIPPAAAGQETIADGAASSGDELARERQRTFLLTVAGLAAAVGGVGAFLLHRRSRSAAAVRPVSGQAGRQPESASAAREVARVAEGPGARPKICPTCGERYESRAIRCSADGTDLVLLN
jgi:hypothetical protein